MYVFDLDGVLISTRKARRLAYADLGMSVDERNLVDPWTVWLPKRFVTSLDQGDSLHQALDLQNRLPAALDKRADAIRPMAAAMLAMRLGNFAVLSEMERPMIEHVLRRHLGIDPSGVAICADLDEQGRLEVLRKFGKRNGAGFYLAEEHTRALNARTVLPPTWFACSP